MPLLSAAAIILTAEQEQDLLRLSRAHKTPRKLAERAAMILLSAGETPVREIARWLGVWPKTVRHWRARWLASPEKALVVTRLADAPRPGTPATFTPVSLYLPSPWPDEWHRRASAKRNIRLRTRRRFASSSIPPVTCPTALTIEPSALVATTLVGFLRAWFAWLPIYARSTTNLARRARPACWHRWPRARRSCAIPPTASAFTSPPSTHPGSTRSRSGSPFWRANCSLHHRHRS